MTMTMRQSAARHRVRRGFTMVELIVTISIIAVLVALTVYAASSLVLRSETQRTQDALKLLESAAQEWSIASERQITFGANGIPTGATYEIDEATLVEPSYVTVPNEAQFIVPPAMPDETLDTRKADDATRQFIRRIEKTPAIREMLARIDSKLLRKGHDEDSGPDPTDWTIVRDAWDNPIRVILPGRDHLGDAEPDSQTIRDSDGSILTDFEIKHGRCVSRTLFFVSAGPDGKFGDLQLDDPLTPALQDDIDLAADNVYSSTPGLERPLP